jgi:hypothetical protein
MSTETRAELQYLQVLSICHYVAAVLLGLCSCGPLFYVGLGFMMATSRLPMNRNAQEPPPEIMGWIFIVMGVGLTVLGWIMAVCAALAGRFLSQRKHYTYCLVIAGFDCLWMPIGTVLGVFTFVVLLRESVRNLFEQAAVPENPQHLG